MLYWQERSIAGGAGAKAMEKVQAPTRQSAIAPPSLHSMMPMLASNVSSLSLSLMCSLLSTFLLEHNEKETGAPFLVELHTLVYLQVMVSANRRSVRISCPLERNTKIPP